MVKCKRWIVVKHFEGEPKISDLRLVEEELPPIQDGGKFSATSPRPPLIYDEKLMKQTCHT